MVVCVIVGDMADAEMQHVLRFELQASLEQTPRLGFPPT
jgi:hypothetical protein